MTVIKGKISGVGDVEIRLDGERIADISIDNSNRHELRLPDDDVRIAPGFIDIQVNGFAGVDLNQANFRGDELVGVCRNLLTTGVTRFCPTLITANPKQLARNIKEIRRACERHSLVRKMVLGIHLEGPYINPEDGPRGAHPRAHVARPDWGEFERLLLSANGLVRMVTVAPEVPGGLAFIQKASQSGLVVGIGHCKPEPEIIDQAVGAGARISTHLGNGTHQMLDRHQNYLQKQLAHDGLMASIICDGSHLPDYFVKNVVRAKGKSKVILITDATAASHAPAGRYSLGDLEIEAAMMAFSGLRAHLIFQVRRSRWTGPSPIVLHLPELPWHRPSKWQPRIRPDCLTESAANWRPASGPIWSFSRPREKKSKSCGSILLGVFYIQQKKNTKK